MTRVTWYFELIASDPAVYVSELLRTSQDLDIMQLLLCSTNPKAADSATFRLASGRSNLKGPALLYLKARCRHLLPSHPLQKTLFIFHSITEG